MALVAACVATFYDVRYVDGERWRMWREWRDGGPVCRSTSRREEAVKTAKGGGMKIYTVCGNGIGSSLLLKMKVEQIAAAHGISVEVTSLDANSAAAASDADLFVTVKEFADLLPDDRRMAVVTSYTNAKQVEAELLPVLESLGASRS